MTPISFLAAPSRRHAARAVARAVALSAALAACGEPHRWAGSPINPPAPAPPLALTGAGGRAFDLTQERGRAVLVFFGYTKCPDVCPTTLADWAKTRAALGTDTAKVRFLFVSVDPARDTPDSAAAYARRFDPAFVGVSGSAAAVERVTSAWGIATIPDPEAPADGSAPDPHAGHGAHGTAAGAKVGAPPPPGGTLTHTGRTFLVDPEGRLRLLYAPNTSPTAIAADLRALL